MLIFAILAVFIAGLMIGRTPEYLGKKIEAHEMQPVSMAILITPILVLGGTAIAVLATAGKAGIANPGPHGFSEILYAFTSAANNNGSGLVGQHTVLQHDAGPLWCDRAGAGDCGCIGREKALDSHRRHDAHAWPAVCHLADRHGFIGRLAELCACPGAGAGGRAFHAVTAGALMNAPSIRTCSGECPFIPKISLESNNP